MHLRELQHAALRVTLHRARPQGSAAADRPSIAADAATMGASRHYSPLTRRPRCATQIVSDPETKKAAVIDPVMDFDGAAGRTHNEHNDAVLEAVAAGGYDVTHILETHVHADHLTGAGYLKDKLPSALTGIGENVVQVQKLFQGVFNMTDGFTPDGSQFDLLLSDGQEFAIGKLPVKVFYSPGHTPACVCYHVGDALFTGDTLFMEDFGTARCDFPGGSAETMYASVQRLYAELPDETRCFVGHDYQPGGRELRYETTLGVQKASNKQLTASTTLEEFVGFRKARDDQLGMPKLIIASLQVNLRNGRFPPPEDDGKIYLKIPINVLGM